MMMWLRRLGGVAGLAMLVVLFSAPVGLVQAALVWETETADAAGFVGGYTSLALDSQYQPHISYLDFTNGDLKYATFDGSDWQTETVDAEGIVGGYTSLALASDGQPHISYVDLTNLTNDDLKYATFDGSAWQTETVDAVGLVGGYTSLALDSQGRPHISYYNDYYDEDNGDLKYATFDGSDWQIETVDAEGIVGGYTSLALDSQNHPHISYYDFTNDDLKYATFDGTAWQTETVDAAAFVGRHTALALDSQNQPHISYYDDRYGALKYATFDGTDWQTETVDTAGIVGRHTALALDNLNHPHISYSDDTNDDLKYTTFDGTAWQTETVDAEGSVGWYTALALDGQNQPHISYYDRTNLDLKYAQLTNNEPPTVAAGGPYSGDEGGPITLDGVVNDPESDELTTIWTYETDDADAGTTCAFGDANAVETTFTCTDDGAFTVTLEASDGLNPAVTTSATVTISNVAPTITEATSTLAGSQVTIAVDAVDPNENDVLNYAFDCDANGSYEVDAEATPTTTCPLNPQLEGSFTFGVQVSDDDGGVVTDTVTVTIATELCASNITGVLRYTSTCHGHEAAVTIPGPEPVTVCASLHNGLLRLPLTGLCARHETSYALPDDGPLTVCVSNYTQTMRVVTSINLCTGHEYGRVIAATEVGETTTPRVR